ncbi:dTDP-6-deoxy-L-talose 4-dehydrogenase [NAD(P)+] [Thermocatellispora tengchongensis]|uniref:dTDP-6-deoxy-L-talose 4-dehydrogenase [NAD(P)+] n=1 Tax=Thermocatellispora tengchongensis TaxID=1073253 RepID=A0A840PFV6_9ACTN|nr:NAD(P)-dependent oxidoreductase [Thermocatellispora tengchongensis]MBB5136027.1 dTDP-6-deoxy-L-talose 4-dehydrogenase [NAD(P)+] [Thermocatellispora tengchongensis]
MPFGGRVMVLGGTGFVGRHICDAFAAAGGEVLATGRRPPPARFAHPFLRLDLSALSASALAATLEEVRPRVVVNAVGSIWSKTEPEMWPAVTLPTLSVVEAMGLMTHRPRLIHLGSVLEYGSGGAGMTVGAHTAAVPTSEYGKAKLAATEAVVAAARTGGVDAMVLRVANCAGPGTPQISLLGQVAEHLLAAAGGGTATVRLSPLRAHRDYVDVRDVADAVALATAAPVCGEVVDIGRGEVVAVRSLVHLLIELSGIPARLLEVEAGRTTKAGSDEDWLQVDISRAAELLGWRPRRTLRESVRDFWRELTLDAEVSHR